MIKYSDVFGAKIAPIDRILNLIMSVINNRNAECIQEFVMTHILKVNSSLFDNGADTQGVSTQLANSLTDALMQTFPAMRVEERDFHQDPVPHLDHAWLQALGTPAAQRSAEQQRQVAYSDDLIAQVQKADILVIGAPMYNFSVPSMLKAWIDHLARAGVSFRYTEEGPVGLLRGKRIYIVVTAGGHHEPGVSDFVRPYLQTALGLLGLTDITFITAQGVNLGPEQRNAALVSAQAQIAEAVGAFINYQTDERGKAA
jgi:FMN-dependent NADH-azoreductase